MESIVVRRGNLPGATSQEGKHKVESGRGLKRKL